MSGTTKAILSMCVLLLAALVVYYGMTPKESFVVEQPEQQKVIQQKPMFNNAPSKLWEKPILGIPQSAAKLTAPDPIASSPEQVPSSSSDEGEDLPVEMKPQTSKRVVPQQRMYEVLVGETLGEIASRELGSYTLWQKIAELNGISDPSQLTPGMKLRLPPIPEKSSEAEAIEPIPTKTPESNEFVQHVVVEGDTLSSIAAEYFGNPNAYNLIAKANPSVNPNKLSIGMKLVIPKN